MQKTAIEWTNQTWNPVHGCSKVSAGCKMCYAETLSLRYKLTAKEWTRANETENVQLKPHKLDEPLRLPSPEKAETLKAWTAGESQFKPLRIFVNSMSDLFHELIPDWYRAAVFAVMAAVPYHTFQVLTKRTGELYDWQRRYELAIESAEYRALISKSRSSKLKAALEAAPRNAWSPNVWLGATVESYLELGRIDDLREIPAAVRFLSCEPLLSRLGHSHNGLIYLAGIHWVIVGGESGAHLREPKYKRRWLNMDYAREIRDNCVNQGVAFFFKQNSGLSAGREPYLIDRDGKRYYWRQFPDDMSAPIAVATGEAVPLEYFKRG